jgi:hypothetical protein
MPPKAWKILVGIGFVALIGFIVYSATGLGQVSCRICVEFHGRKSCPSAAGTNQEEAVRTAVGIACAELAAGRTESIACERTPPTTVMCK